MLYIAAVSVRCRSSAAVIGTPEATSRRTSQHHSRAGQVARPWPLIVRPVDPDFDM